MVVDEKRIVPDGSRRATASLDQLEALRDRTIKEIRRTEIRLSQMRMRGKNLRRGGLVALHLQEREGLKANLEKLTDRLRQINAAIKAGRRAGMALMLTGQPLPTDERALVATLYRLYVDVVPPAEQDDYQRGIMALARDYVQVGPSVFQR